MLGAALGFCLSSTLVHKSKQLGNCLNVVRLELPHQLLVGDSFAECHDKSIRLDEGYGVPHLTETLDVLAQCCAVKR